MSNQTENGKCTDVTNHWSRVGLSTPIYTNHHYNYKKQSLLRTLLSIITDRTNQSSWPDAGQIFVLSMEFSAVNRKHPSCKTPLGPGAKKDGCFRRLVSVHILTINISQWACENFYSKKRNWSVFLTITLGLVLILLSIQLEIGRLQSYW